MRIVPGTLIASALIGGLALTAFATSPLLVQEAFLKPDRADEGQAVTVTVTGKTDMCAPLFSEKVVTVSQSGGIMLTARAEPNIAANCGPGPYDYDLEFRIPALKVGVYPVYIALQPACLYDAQPCDIAIQTKYAGLFQVGPKAPVAYIIDPTQAKAGVDFTLNLLSYQFDCGTTFDNLAVAVDGKTLTLTFLDHAASPGYACPAIYKPYGPAFKVKALAAGSYQVKAYRLPACHPCEMAGTVADAGTLRIGEDTVRKGWFLEEKHVYPDQAFSLRLLNHDLDNCLNSFSSQNLVVDGKSIYASFLVESHPERLCIQAVSPHGPVFGMQGLKLGAYPVHVTELLECEVTKPYCAVDRLLSAPSDTLMVMQTLSALISDLRARAPKADMRGSRAAIRLPEGKGGIWRADLLTPTGRKLSTASVNAQGGSSAEFEMGIAPKRGIYLLRLAAPDGKRHLIPIVRQD